MKHTRRLRGLLHWTLGILSLLAWWQVAEALSQGPEDANRAAAVQAFDERMARYAAVRERLEEPLPPFEAQRDDWSRMLRQRYLASAIRGASRGARLGQVFLPSVSAAFREMVAEAVVDTHAEGLIDPEQHTADALVDLVPYEPVPAWAMEALPPELQHRLPPLPAGVEYRKAGGDLLLWDVRAGILIDALQGAFMPR